jgi:hypothetical protein
MTQNKVAGTYHTEWDEKQLNSIPVLNLFLSINMTNE